MLIDNHEFLPLAEYAEKVGRSVVSVRQKCIRGNVPGARKVGRDWFIPADAPYVDMKIKSGAYIGWREKKQVK